MTPGRHSKSEVIPCHHFDIEGKAFICAPDNRYESISSSILEDTIHLLRSYLHQLKIDECMTATRDELHGMQQTRSWFWSILPFDIKGSWSSNKRHMDQLEVKTGLWRNAILKENVKIVRELSSGCEIRLTLPFVNSCSIFRPRVAPNGCQDNIS